MSRDTKLKAGVIAAAVVLLGGLLAWRLGGGGGAPDLANSLLMIDIQDGTVYRVPVGGRQTLVLPAANPQGERTLLPIAEVEGGGSYEIARLYRDSARPEEYNGQVVDPSTGRVLVPVERPVSLR